MLPLPGLCNSFHKSTHQVPNPSWLWLEIDPPWLGMETLLVGDENPLEAGESIDI